MTESSRILAKRALDSGLIDQKKYGVLTDGKVTSEDIEISRRLVKANRSNPTAQALFKATMREGDAKLERQMKDPNHEDKFYNDAEYNEAFMLLYRSVRGRSALEPL